MKKKIVIIGCGAVGSASAYALILKKLAVNLVLIDPNEMQCRGELLDLSDALSFCDSGTSIVTGSYQDAHNADLIIISAGARQQLGQPRTELLPTNKKIIEEIMGKLHPINPNAIIIMVTNPLDILAYHAWKLSGLPQSQVFGTGTFLDSKRLGRAIAEHIGIPEQAVTAYVLGEHGDSQVDAWSMTHINGFSIATFPELTPDLINSLSRQAKDKAYEIITCKQATYYGIGTCVATICAAIVQDQKMVIPVSCFNPTFGIFLSVPVIIGEKGIEGRLRVILNDTEQQLLETSAQKIQKITAQL